MLSISAESLGGGILQFQDPVIYWGLLCNPDLCENREVGSAVLCNVGIENPSLVITAFLSIFFNADVLKWKLFWSL